MSSCKMQLVSLRHRHGWLAQVESSGGSSIQHKGQQRDCAFPKLHRHPQYHLVVGVGQWYR